jgi:hypothetical protein
MGTAALRRWLGAATIIGALLLAAVPNVASAATPPSTTRPSTAATMHLFLNGIAVSPGGDVADEPLMLEITDGSGITEVDDLTVTLDTSKLPAGTTMTLFNPNQWPCSTPTGSIVCTAPGPVPVTHSIGNPFWDVNMLLSVDVSAPPNAGYGLGSLAATATMAGLASATRTAPVAIAQPVDLVANPTTSFTGPPGSTYSSQWTVTNAGPSTVHGVTVSIESDAHFDLTKQYSNCQYYSPNVAICRFDNDLMPGETYTVSEPVSVRIAADHVAPFHGATEVDWLTPFDRSADSTAAGTPGTGGPLGLVVRSTQAPAPPLTQPELPQTDPNFLGSTFVDVTVSGVNPADLAAIGSSASVSSLGGSVAITVGVTNHGPAVAALSRSGDALTAVIVTLPTGTTAAAVPDNCAPFISGIPNWQRAGAPGFSEYECLVFQDLAVQQNYPLPFTVQVPAGPTPLQGSVSVMDDLNPAGNTASIVITPQVLGRQVGTPAPPMPRR